MACGWRIVISPMIPEGFPSCHDSGMRNLIVLFIHFIATLVRLLGPGGVRSMVAESLLLKHQLLIVNRSRQRSPNLSGWDCILAGVHRNAQPFREIDVRHSLHPSEIAFFSHLTVLEL